MKTEERRKGLRIYIYRVFHKTTQSFHLLFYFFFWGGEFKIQNSTHLASWIYGISISYFKVQSNYLASITSYLIQTKLAEKNMFLKIYILLHVLFVFKLEIVKAFFENEKL